MFSMIRPPAVKFIWSAEF